MSDTTSDEVKDFRYTDEMELRKYCLELASQNTNGLESYSLVGLAETYFKFIKNGSKY